jgi:uncharacterized protein (TIGR02246 family)
VAGTGDVLAEYLSAWQAGDPERASSFYADDVVMRLPGRGSLAGVHEGRAAVVKAIEGLLARTGGTAVTVEVLDRLESAERVAMVLREVAVHDTERLELRRVNIYRVTGGKIVEIDIFEADQYDVDEFFG